MSDTANAPSTVHGTDLPLPNDPSDTRLQKLARIALDSMGHFVALLDSRGAVLAVNRAALDRGGIELSDVEGRPFWTTFWWQVSGEVAPKLREMIGRASKGEAVRWDAEIFARPGEQETILIDASLRPVIDERGEVAFLCAECRDVTEQMIARGEIERLREAAESAGRAKDEFLSMLGHELRNPLSPILTALELIKAQGSDRSERAYTILERQVTHLARLVDDLLDVSRIAHGKVELRIETVEISEIVAKAIEMASPLLEQRNHTLMVDVPRRGLHVNGDSVRLSQVIANLLTNAAKYTPQRGGRITVLAEEEGDSVVVRVIDTGIGIAPDVIPRVFDLFVRDGQKSDRSAGGLGLGLAIVRNLVERHGGSVSARSAGPGRGSEFTVRLPRAERAGNTAASSNARSAAAAAERDGGGQRVLVVDDNTDGAEMLAAMLRYLGHEVRVAHNGPVALRLAEEFRPAIALLDLGLPVMDGYELASRLRAMPELDGLHLIAVTGYGQDSDRRKTRDAGFHQHLVKPVTIEIVGGAVSAATDTPGTAG